ncbi:MAG: hypothetical protein H6836_07515 [Planctomycetes bacterium]|nr:hypothetical protein [Planctomycetota bacterium]MCB9889412.1 hypothetical protein [Planctomycetota bacterium]
MLKNIMLTCATLAGLAVPSLAQRGHRDIARDDVRVDQRIAVVGHRPTRHVRPVVVPRIRHDRAPLYRMERVWVPGCERRVWVPPCYEFRRDHCGRMVRVCVRAGYFRTYCEPGRWEYRRVLVRGHAGHVAFR